MQQNIRLLRNLGLSTGVATGLASGQYLYDHFYGSNPAQEVKLQEERIPRHMGGLSIAPGLRARIKKVISSGKITKYHTVTSTLTSVPSTGGSQNLQLIALDEQGDDLTKRVGRRIKVSGVKFNGYFLSGDPTNLVRIVVLRADDSWDFSSNYPTLTEDLKKWVQTHNTASDARIKIYMQKTIKMNENFSSIVPSTDAETFHKVSKPFNKFVKYGKKGVTIEYIDNSTDSKKYKYYMYMVSDSTASTHPGYTGEFTLRFKDID